MPSLFQRPVVAATGNGRLSVVQYLAAHGANLDKANLVAEHAEHDDSFPEAIRRVGRWLAASAKIGRLELLVALRLHARVAKLMRQGGGGERVCLEEADMLPHGTLQAMVGKPPSFPWPALFSAADKAECVLAGVGMGMDLEDAEGVKATEMLVRKIARGWQPTSHWLHGPRVRATVNLMLLISERLWRVYAQSTENDDEQAHRIGGRNDDAGGDAGADGPGGVVGDAARYADSGTIVLLQPGGGGGMLLPVLPGELWTFVVFKFLSRSEADWPT